jgi:hypothetical protein
MLHQKDSGHAGDTGLVPDGSCAVDHARATLVPAYLVFVMDRSDSMRQYGKFPACSAALDRFFADPSTTGISSSLTFMPYFATDGGAASCTATDYETPEVPMTALPSDAFAPVIAAEKLGLGTPTTPALQGAVRYAKTIKTAHPNDRVLIVLATDGYPAGCPNNAINNVANVAAISLSSDGIPVYVIGVGPDTDANAGIGNLNEVAEAGGTHSAFFIATETDGGDSGVTTEAFLAAVKQIQGSLRCHYGIPAAPAGQTIDPAKVNVVFTTGSSSTTLGYSAGCTNADGWQYLESDAGVPQEIVLCPTSCAAATTAGTSGSMNIVFGCTTQGGTPP